MLINLPHEHKVWQSQPLSSMSEIPEPTGSFPRDEDSLNRVLSVMFLQPETSRCCSWRPPPFLNNLGLEEARQNVSMQILKVHGYQYCCKLSYKFYNTRFLNLPKFSFDKFWVHLNRSATLSKVLKKSKACWVEVKSSLKLINLLPDSMSHFLCSKKKVGSYVNHLNTSSNFCLMFAWHSSDVGRMSG